MLIEGEKTEEASLGRLASFPEKPWKIFIWEAFLFSLTFILGITSALRITKILEVEKIPITPTSFFQFISSFIFVIVIVFLIIKFVKFPTGKGILFKTLFILAVFSGGILFFELWLGEPLALILISFLIFLWLREANIFIHNFLLILGMAGISSVFGLRLDPLTVVILLAIFSIYDIIAVYKTKHMIKMAKAMIETGAIPGVILPSQVSELKTSIKTIRPGGKFLVLGGGDVVFPLLLCVSLVPEGILKSSIVAIFALLGLLLSFWIFLSQKTRQPIPALPPIALFSIIGYFFTLII